MDSDPTLKLLVEEFNYLPRPKKIKLQDVNTKTLVKTYDNIWHFGIRMIESIPPLPPQRILYLYLSGSGTLEIISAIEYPGYDSDVPEGMVDANVRARVIIPHLIGAFTGHFGRTGLELWKRLRPWSLMVTRDFELARAVGEGLMHSGADYKCGDLCMVRTAIGESTWSEERCWRAYRDGIYRIFGIVTGPDPGEYMSLDGGGESLSADWGLEVAPITEEEEEEGRQEALLPAFIYEIEKPPSEEELEEEDISILFPALSSFRGIGTRKRRKT
ncbi:hypothetical protein TWF481_009587 [Arthrobotrys musiformis]|uniref:Uncharacterized protein n=1 Tax=Arthrobotrys musiformis TaxID=47236 RepID=A0AAV9W667_9PEZI